MRAVIPILLLLTASWPAFAGPVFPHHSGTGVAEADVIVAVLDTGADGAHAEFGGYVGQSGVTDPQIVAWWDFGVHGPAPAGDVWDDATPVPFDSCPAGAGCHGTGTASLVGGATVGAYPGVKLAIAKVANGAGELVNIEAAMRWAVDTVGADVLSVSLGTQVPVPGHLVGFDEEVARAKAAGVLVVVSAGNGLLNAGARVPSELDQPSGSPHVLVVGAVGKDGSRNARLTGATFSNTDPDVVSWGASVKMAKPGVGHRSASGTSFSTPLVAGWAAQVIAAAREADEPADPDRIERLLSWTADDDVAVPFAIEGFGFVAHGGWSAFDTVAAAIAHATAGTTPAPPLQAPIDDGIETVRSAWSDREGATLLVARGATAPHRIDASALAARDVDAWSIALAARETLEVRVTWTDDLGAPAAAESGNDLDVYLYPPGAGDLGVFLHDEVRAISAKPGLPGLNEESFTYRAETAGTYTLTVEGFLVGAAGQSYALEAWIDGVTAAPTFVGDHVGLVGKNA